MNCDSAKSENDITNTVMGTYTIWREDSTKPEVIGVVMEGIKVFANTTLKFPLKSIYKYVRKLLINYLQIIILQIYNNSLINGLQVITLH